MDDQLDRRLGEAYRLIHPVRRSILPFWRTHALPLRALGELRMEANDIFERTGNVLKLVGDQYLARVYRLLAGRFHLDTWERSIERSLRTMEDVYGIVSDRADTFRAEFMEVVIIVLIALEIILTVFKITRQVEVGCDQESEKSIAATLACPSPGQYARRLINAPVNCRISSRKRSSGAMHHASCPRRRFRLFSVP